MTKLGVWMIWMGLCTSVAAACASDSDQQEATEAAAFGQTREAIGLGSGQFCQPGAADYPECKKEEPPSPTIPLPSCNGKSGCYCVCRVHHPCATDPSECDALSECLNDCDDDFPAHCTATGNPNPHTLRDCL